MKKVLFIQNNGSTSGGVWSVNKTLALHLKRLGYDTLVMSIREKFKIKDVPDELSIYTVNKKDKWEVPQKRDIKEDLKNYRFIRAFKKAIQNRKRISDIKKAKDFIKKFNPDYIIASHYQVLDGIPEEYLSKTINVHHSSFENVLSNKSIINTLNKYNNKITFCWLSKTISEQATKYGLKNNYYVYNPVKFLSRTNADVINNKRLVVLTRFTEEKRIDLMIKIVEKIFEDKKFKDWKFYLYGDGILKKQIKKGITNHEQVIFKESTNDAKKAYLKGSINLNTSSFEGFPMSILEASECGVPTVTFNYGESSKEQVINDKTGIIVPQDDVPAFIESLKDLMSSKRKLKSMSKECKIHNEIFSVKKVTQDWINLFKEIDKKGDTND